MTYSKFQTPRQGFLLIKSLWSQTNKSVQSGKQIRPMCGCHCYYLWSLSLNRLLARCARNGQSGLDCINYSSSPLYMAVPCHTILYQTYHYIPTYYTTLPCHTTKHNAIPNHAISYQHIPYHINYSSSPLWMASPLYHCLCIPRPHSFWPPT